MNGEQYKRRKRIEKMLCAKCGKPLDDVAFIHCQECRDKIAARKRKQRERQMTVVR